MNQQPYATLIYIYSLLRKSGEIFISSTISGTILALIWSHIHYIFPLAAENGIIPYNLGWWNAICITWIFGILLKPVSITNNKFNSNLMMGDVSKKLHNEEV